MAKHGNVQSIPDTLLAVDQATVSGYCLMGHSGSLDALGTIDLSRHRGNRPMILWAFSKALGELCDQHNPEMLVFETPYTRNAKTALITYSLAGLIEIQAAARQIMVADVHPSAIKKLATGKGNADKEMMMSAMPHDVEYANDNEADAYWLARFWTEHLQEIAYE